MKKEILCYPLPIRTEKEKLIKTLFIFQKITNEYLQKLYKEDILISLKNNKLKSYKILEQIEKRPKYIASRINRCILESCGRILRSVNERKELFEILINFSKDPKQWNYQKLIKEKNIYKKAFYIENLKEQTLRFMKEKGKLPLNFFELQKCPTMKKPIITYAPDDGQAIQMKINEKKLELKLKVPKLDEADEIIGWEWIKIFVPLPANLHNSIPVSPDIRLKYIHGKLLPVIDYKIEVPIQEVIKTEYFITVDWGTRKLLTICIFDKNGNQISTPIFLKFTPLRNKLEKIRKNIDDIKSKRDKISKKSALFKKYNKKIAQLWRKFRAINKALSHLAANVIIAIAKLYNCSEIYVENLKGLKSKKSNKDLNWIINTTVRQAIYSKVEYKASIEGIAFKRPVHASYTSQYCPRCGEKGHHVKSPNHNEEFKSGSWFVCNNCKYQADRDYVATCNLARKVLYGNSLKKSKCISYKKCKSLISQLLFRESNFPVRKKLRSNLIGWHKSLSLAPWPPSNKILA